MWKTASFKLYDWNDKIMKCKNEDSYHIANSTVINILQNGADESDNI